MKVKLKTSILILIISVSCAQSEENDNDSNILVSQKTDLSFEEYLDKIPEIKLPLSMTCEIELDGSSFGIDSKVIAKFGPENSFINGIIEENERFTAIIYLYPADIILPIIQTTDSEGNKISELKVYEKWCGEDEFSWGTSWANISDDLTISLCDSVITYERSEEGQINEESKSTEVRERVFKINRNGIIIEN